MIVYPLTFLAALIEGELSLLILAFWIDAWQVPLTILVPLAATGAFIGDAVCFELGRRKGTAWLETYPKLRRRVEKTGSFLGKTSWLMIPLLRFQLGMRMAGHFSLGMGEMPRQRYSLINAVSCTLWSVVILPLCVWFTPLFLKLLRDGGLIG